MTDATLARLRAAFQRPPPANAGRPLGVMLLQDVDVHAAAVIRAVAGCSHLVLNGVTDASVPAPHAALLDALSAHQRLRYLRISGPAAGLADAMRVVATTCKQLHALEIQMRSPDSGHLDAIVAGIAAMQSLRCLTIGTASSQVRWAVFAPALHLPLLSTLRLRFIQLDGSGTAAVLAALAARASPLRVLLLDCHRFTDATAAQQLCGTTARGLLRSLVWLELGACLDTYPRVFDAFVANSIPAMTNLQRLDLVVNNGSIKDPVERIRAALPHPELLQCFQFNNQPVPCGDAVPPMSVQQLATMMVGPDVDPRLEPALQQQHRVCVSSTSPPALQLRVCRDVLPRLPHLSKLTLSISLTPALADVLRDVLPQLRSLRTLVLTTEPLLCCLLRRVCSRLRVYALVNIDLVSASLATCVVPVEVMRAGVSVAIQCTAADLISLPAHHHYHLPEHADRPLPSSVPALYDLAASVVLTQLPEHLDLGRLPQPLSRPALRQHLHPCAQCGVYRRLVDAWLSVRCLYQQAPGRCLVVGRVPAQLVEVTRCYTCAIESPAVPLPPVRDDSDSDSGSSSA